jgi:predicted HAD superfamily Cof-like phosphohydrolase
MDNIMTNFEMVAEFMTAFDQEVHTNVHIPNEDTQKLRVALIEEELGELSDAIRDNDIIEVADALTDLLYVVYGAGHAFGLDLDKCFKEVHASNMSKLGDDGKPIHREDGKVLKGPSFFQPNLHKCLNWSYEKA